MPRRSLLLFLLAAVVGRAETALPPGDALLPADSLGRFVVVASNGAKLAAVAEGGPGFARSWRIETQRDFSVGAWVALRAPLDRGFRPHETGVIQFYARALATTDESNTGRVEVKIGPPDGRSPVFESRVSFGRDWQEYFLPFEASRELAGSDATIALGFGFMRQTVEIGAIPVIACGLDQPLAKLPHTRFSYVGRDPEAAWRRDALERIEKLRKGDVHLAVVDDAGHPVAGAQVQLMEERAEFQWGSALQFARLVQDSPENQAYRQRAIELFNSASPENDLKWVTWAGDYGPAYSHQQAIAALHWLQEHHFHVRGHVLVWPSYEHLPKLIWPYKFMPMGDPKVPAMIDDHIREMAAVTRGLVEEWDVENEPFANHEIMDQYRQFPPIEVHWFQLAHQAMPDVRLFLNDYSNHDRSTDAAHVEAFRATAQRLLQAGAPLGGLGLQAHIDEQPNAPVEVLKVLNEYQGSLHLPVRVTEFDVRTDDEQLQADYTRDFMTLLFSHPSVIGFQLWGFWESAHWRPSAAMYRADWSEKPNGAVYRDLVLHQWRTNLAAPAGPDGRVEARAFYGDYVARATVGGRRGEAHFTLKSGEPAPTVTLQLSP